MSTTVHYAFLHGGAQGGWVWDETIAALERQQPGLAARCLKLDVPGCGNKRGRDTRALTVADVITELDAELRSEEHTSELQSLMRISYAVFCLKKKKHITERNVNTITHHQKHIFNYKYRPTHHRPSPSTRQE